MKTKNLMPFVVLVLLGGIAGVVLGLRHAAQDSGAAGVPARHPSGAASAHPELPPALPPEAPEAARPRPLTAIQEVRLAAEAAAKAAMTAPPAGPRPPLATEPVSHDLARAALLLVGEDPDADAYWLRAINDPALSAKERQDLIEDLNEVGLSDPRQPGSEDLALILARLQLIEEHGEDPLDEVNANAFAEAYKDLLNLLDTALGNPPPPAR